MLRIIYPLYYLTHAKKRLFRLLAWNNVNGFVFGKADLLGYCIFRCRFAFIDSPVVAAYAHTVPFKFGRNRRAGRAAGTEQAGSTNCFKGILAGELAIAILTLDPFQWIEAFNKYLTHRSRSIGL